MEQHHTTHHSEEQHGSVRLYIIGFALSIVLTLVAFGLVEIHFWSGHRIFTHQFLYTEIVVCAVLQFFVQMFCFLSLGKRGGNLNRVAFAFAVIVVGIVVAGSLWIMQNLNGRMMMPQEQMLQYMNDES